MTSETPFPLITFGITCFNAADTIARAVESAVKQDWPNKEIIVVDDASSDGSQGVLWEIAKRQSKLRVIRASVNQGMAAGLNRILAEAQGEFVAFLDDDDESRQDRLTKQWQRLTDYERLHDAELVLCYSNRNVVLGGEAEPDHIGLAIGREPPEPNGPIVAKYLFGHLIDSHHVWGNLGSGTLMARRRTFGTLGGFDEGFRRWSEWDFAVRAALKGAHFIAVNEPLITQHKTHTADKSGRTSLEYALRLTRKHKHYLANEKVYLSSVAWAHARFHAKKGHFWMTRFFRALALVFLPPSVLFSKLASRFARAVNTD